MDSTMDLNRFHVNGKKKSKEEILASILNNYKVKCKCGHTLILIGRDKVICNHCGYYVYKDKKQEFQERMRKLLNG